MDVLTVPPPLRHKLGDAGSDGLVMMFAEAHRMGLESAERYAREAEARMQVALDRQLSAFRVEMLREMSSLRFDVIRWNFLFWIGQFAATMAVLSWALPRQ